MLTRDQIQQAQDLKTETVAVPEWGGDVIVSEMTGFARDGFEQSIAGVDGGKRDLSNLRARLLVRTLVDEAGIRLYADDEIGLLGNKSATVLDRLFAVAQRLNVLGAEHEAAAEKNLDAVPSGDSTSDSA